MTYLRRVLIALDQLAGAVLIGTYPDETISAAAHRRGWRRTEAVINWLFRDPTHCEASYQAEVRRTQTAKEYRK